ncbi:VCBS repeat-containing protein [Engelhardtia mirabilis]|uniref:FG-GAP repeat protein n=1 Tax=Engelhardtia mirabilis TaxID=2528011 RepID=A0A518BSK5_9BACT|nr:FG-GAP repeat protein [Planctomycetes bacterium Pla133]QDV04281.1 FG-GAP repeat protein [Planctomycetes bacterium Pla86]
MPSTLALPVVRHAAACTLAASLLTCPTFAQVNDFADLDWTFSGPNSASGSIDDEVMVIVGPDHTCDGELVAWYTCVAPVSGTVRATLYWTNFDSWALSAHPIFDWPLYQVDGVAEKLGTTGTFTEYWFTGVYDVNFDVQRGQVFGFGVETKDCAEGPGSATFFDIELQPAAWIDLGQGLDPSVDLVVPAPASPTQFEAGLVALGDVNGDGIGDFATAAPIAVLSGADGAFLWSESTAGPDLPLLRNAGDVDGDGVADLAMGQFAAPMVRLLSGASGSSLWSWTAPAGEPYGVSLACFGDLDGDGVLDVAVGADEYTSLAVQVLSGATGTVLAPILPPTGAKFFGAVLGNVGDLDQDGLSDLGVVASPLPLQIHSGATGQLDRQLGPYWNDRPTNLQSAGDWNGDGQPDVALGLVPISEAFELLPGRVEVWSGSDGAVLLEREGDFPHSRFGSVLTGDFDLDGDGSPELVVAAGGQTAQSQVVPGHVVVLRAPQGDVLCEFMGEEALEVRGIAWDPTPGQARLAVAVDSVLAGRELRLFSDFAQEGTPHLELAGPPSPGGPLTISIEAGNPGRPALVFVGLSSIDLPLAGGVLVPSPDLIQTLQLDGDGRADLITTWPDAVPAGTKLWAQAWIPDVDGPFGQTATNAVVTPLP